MSDDSEYLLRVLSPGAELTLYRGRQPGGPAVRGA
jgi:hypothetical protein